MTLSKLIWQKTYHGFEDFADYWRDVDEAVNSDFNLEMKTIPGEFLGKITVTITYEPSEEDRLANESP